MRIFMQLTIWALFIGIDLTQTTNVATKCQSSCKETNNENDKGSWVVHWSYGITYFYIKQYNCFVIVNLHLQTVGIIDGTHGTFFLVLPNTGFGGIQNMQTRKMYIFPRIQTSDISGIPNKDYRAVIGIVNTVLPYTANVVGKNIDTTQKDYIDDLVLLHDYYITSDFTKMVSIRNQPHLIKRFRENFQSFADTLHGLLQGGKYTPVWGPSVYFVVLMEMNQLNDTLLMEFDEVIVSSIGTLKGKFSPDLMYEYYKIIANQSEQPMDVTDQQFNNLTWAINGVGLTYNTLEMALAAYRNRTVMETQLSIISVNENITKLHCH